MLNPAPCQTLDSVALAPSSPPLMNKTLLPFCFAACLTLGSATALAQRVPPKLITPVSPGYPQELTDTGMNGRAEIDVTVKADGSVADPQLGMATHRAFGKAAMGVVTGWHFQPGTVDGAPADMRVGIPFNFAAPFDQTINALAKRKVFVDSLPEPAVNEKDFPAKKLKVKRPARGRVPGSLAGSEIDEKVQVKLVVAPDGSTLNPTVPAGVAKHKELESPAIQAVALMSFEPPKKDGKAVYVETTYAVEFTTERRGGGGEGGGFGGGGFGGGRGGGGDRGGGGGGGGGEDGGGF